MELQKNMIITNEEYTYRVLALTEELVLVINMSSKNMPCWKNIGEFTDWTLIENLTHTTTLSPKAEQVANKRYGIIAPIIPFIGNEKLRTELITETAIANNVSKATIRKYLCNYLVAQDISALAPKEKLDDKPLSDDEKIFRKSLNKWFFTTKKRTLKNCYTLMLEKYYCDAEGKLLDSVPSYYQFRYFYRKYKKPSTEMISRNSLSYYQRNQRPLIGDGVQGFAGTIGMGMLDSTICNIYLINEAGELIGRPVLTTCVDAYSGLICGYSLSWKGGIYSIRDLMLNIITDKVEHCKKFGIDIEQFQWNCDQLPITFVTDKGSEYAGMNFESISELGISIVNLKSYRADSKGPVEVAFNALDTYMKKKGSRYIIRHQNMNALAIKNKASSFGGILGGMDCCSIIGESGIGKSLSIERTVELLEGNRVIELEETKIIPIINIQCPFDCSTKSLLLSICKRIDEALGTNYYEMQIRAKAVTNIMIVSVAQMLINHCCLLVIDEIQNLVKHKAGSQLVASLTQLLNEAGVGIIMVGTPEIVPFFESVDYLARRTIGLSYSRCAYDEFFFNFCSEIWKYQYVSNKSEITDAIIHYLYEHSAGKLSNVIFLFYTAHEVSILNGRECIDMEALEEAYQRMKMLHSYIEPEIRVEAKTSVRKKKNSKKIIEEKNLGVPCDARITTDFSFKEAVVNAKANNTDIFSLLEEVISVTEIEV